MLRERTERQSLDEKKHEQNMLIAQLGESISMMFRAFMYQIKAIIISPCKY